MLPKIITISGLPGCGKSTTAKSLAEKLNYLYVDAGNEFRDLAKKYKLSLCEFEKYANKHHEVDIELDKQIIQRVTNANGAVLQGRLAAWMCVLNQIEAFKIWLHLPIEQRAQRIASREKISLDQATADIMFRENSIKTRYRVIYGINYDDLSVYDIKVNTSESTETIVANIINLLPNSIDN
jgi:predicted cytidylate kinase